MSLPRYKNVDIVMKTWDLPSYMSSLVKSSLGWREKLIGMNLSLNLFQVEWRTGEGMPSSAVERQRSGASWIPYAEKECEENGLRIN